MAPKDISSVFSRYFVVGFFLPAFFAAMVLGLVLPDEWFPNRYRESSLGSQTLILGGVALLASLLLSGLHHQLLRLFEGYPIERLRGRRMLGSIESWRRGRWEEKFDALDAKRKEPPGSPGRTPAAIRLATCFPPGREQVLPTRFGNAVRSFERHPRQRYGFDGVTIWNRIEVLLSEPEREVVSDDRTDVAFFLNGVVMLATVGLLLLADAASHQPVAISLVWVYLIPFLLAWFAYRSAASAAIRWGSSVRAGFDLHRFEVYDRLGLKTPHSDDEERQVARAATRCLLYAEPLPDNLRKVPDERKTHE